MNTLKFDADAAKPDASKPGIVQHPLGAKTVPPRSGAGPLGQRTLHPFGSMDIGALHPNLHQAPSQFASATPPWLSDQQLMRGASSTGTISATYDMPTDDTVARVFPNNQLSANTLPPPTTPTPLPLSTPHHGASLDHFQAVTGAENTPYTANHAINIWRAANNKIIPPARHPPTSTQTGLATQKAQNQNVPDNTKLLRPPPLRLTKRAMATPPSSRSRSSYDPDANYQPDSSIEGTPHNTRSTRRRLTGPPAEEPTPVSRAPSAASSIVVNGHRCTVDARTGALVASTHGEYKVSPQLQGIRKALGEATWSDYVTLVELLVAGRIQEDDYAKMEGVLFMTWAPNMKVKIRKMVVKMVEMGKWGPRGEGEKA